jgi:hypothetical protein
MSTQVRYLLFRGVIAGTLALASPMALSAEIRAGDGIGTVKSYNFATKSITIGAVDVPLSPKATLSLEQQLASFNWSGSRPFNAKYNVVRDSSGRRVIESIYVYPPNLP